MTDSQLNDLVGRQLSQLYPLELDRTGLGFEQLTDSAHGRGFTGTVGAEDGNNFTLVHFERDPLDGSNAAVRDFQVFYFKQNVITHRRHPHFPGRPR